LSEELDIKTKEKKQGRFSAYILLQYLAAAFLPNIFWLFLFNSNKVLNQIAFSHSLIFAIVFSIVSICLYMLYRFITRRTDAALIILIVSWVPFWLFDSIFSFISNIISFISRIGFAIGHVIVIVVLLLLLRKYNPFEKYSQTIHKVLSGIICLLFLFNSVPTLYEGIVIYGRARSEEVAEIKVDFNVDEQLPSPDVYWLYMDGMMSFDTVYKYFGDSQDEFKIELNKRGFVINEGAELHTGYTQASAAALLSPTFYDSYLNMRLSEVLHLLKNERANEIHKRLETDGIRLYRDIAPRYELFKAFMSKGYSNAITTLTQGTYQPIDSFYSYDDDLHILIQGTRETSDRLIEIENTMFFLTTVTSLSAIRGWVSAFFNSVQNRSLQPLPDYEDEVDSLTKHTLGLEYERDLYRRVLDTQTIDSPKLVYIANYITHAPFIVISVEAEGKDNTFVDPRNVDLLYLLHHEYATQVILNTIDMILERNPDAVIVIQADHGVHSIATQPYMLRMGYSVSEILEMNYSVMSAVRMPPQYGELEEPLDPLNISRLLVNRFVGDNYEMLP